MTQEEGGLLPTPSRLKWRFQREEASSSTRTLPAPQSMPGTRLCSVQMQRQEMSMAGREADSSEDEQAENGASETNPVFWEEQTLNKSPPIQRSRNKDGRKQQRSPQSQLDRHKQPGSLRSDP